MENNKKSIFEDFKYDRSKIKRSGVDYGQATIDALRRAGKIENILDMYTSGNKEGFSAGVKKLEKEEIPLLLRDAREKRGVELYYVVKDILSNLNK